MNEAGRFWSRQCETSREWVSLRLDGELSELEEAMLRRHVAGCGDCQAFAATADSFTSLLRSEPLEASAPFFRVAAEPMGRRRLLGLGAVAAALAASAAVLFAPGLSTAPTSVEPGAAVDVTFDAMRAGQRAQMRLPESITYARVRFIELT